MNYSIIFTEISFIQKTSNWPPKIILLLTWAVYSVPCSCKMPIMMYHWIRVSRITDKICCSKVNIDEMYMYVLSENANLQSVICTYLLR